ncbi:MAG TPA: (4Fe-4S)-binding protein [Deltaproteobacteria bacterium]|nr:(4Fe-4S)-binding protein [Deltaproteobacteria bacterium]
MKELVVISGKGGTGKTSLVASFAALADRAVIADCDVDAADLHLVLNPVPRHQYDFSGGKKARIIQENCTACGLCVEHCRFEAIVYPEVAESQSPGIPAIREVLCEGCGVCSRLCQSDAIAFEPALSGQWCVSDTRFGPLVHARLGIAQGNSGKLVTILRQEAKKIAEHNGHDIIISDGSPGIGCPVIASLTGAHLVLVVTEPTQSGQHDLMRVTELTEYFRIPTTVCVNKWDLNEQMTSEIETLALTKGVQSVGRVRYDSAITRAQVDRMSVIEYTQEPVAQDITAVWNTLQKHLTTG